MAPVSAMARGLGRRKVPGLRGCAGDQRATGCRHEDPDCIAHLRRHGAPRIHAQRDAATEALRQRGICWELLLEPATLLHTMRSVMASLVLENLQYSHLLFVDTDLEFQPASVLKMLDAEREVIGCVYPYRTIPLHETVGSADRTLRQVIAAKVPYAVTLADGTTNLDVVNGICEVASIGTGLLLIRRTALEALAASGRISRFLTTFPYSQWYPHSHYHGFYSHLQADGCDYGEDYSFCRRWRDVCNGRIHALVSRIHALVSDEVGHIGPLPVLGRYLEPLQSGQV